jgi:hypothetical protein
MAKTTRSDVYVALNSERAYQDFSAEKWQHKGEPTLEAELLLIDEYITLSKHAWRTGHGNTDVLEQLRKLGGVLVRCFENYGVVPRPPVPVTPITPITTIPTDENSDHGG